MLFCHNCISCNLDFKEHINLSLVIHSTRTDTTRKPGSAETLLEVL